MGTCRFVTIIEFILKFDLEMTSVCTSSSVSMLNCSLHWY